MPRPGERFRGGDADEERSHEARPLCDGDPLDIAEADIRLIERFLQDGKNQLEVVTRRNLRDDSAVSGVELGLRGDDVREQAPVLRDERGRGLVTRRLNPENGTGETMFPP
jgi:hypothetical protein